MPKLEAIPLLEPKNTRGLDRMPTENEKRLLHYNRSDTKTDADKQVMGSISIDSARNAFNGGKGYKIEIKRKKYTCKTMLW